MTAQAAPPSRESNPFATCWTRPGALPFAPTAQATVGRCLRLLRDNSWRGQIVGAHGAGKSTLLRALHNAAVGEGLPCALLRAEPPAISAPGRIECYRGCGDRLANSDENRVVFLDSFEQLTRWRRRQWRRRRGGLVVTSHFSAGLPTLATLRPSLDDARRLFAQLGSRGDSPVSEHDLLDAFIRCAGNLREVWFELYSLHEHRTRAGANHPA